jgi:photosystem II stability/assembly factor-like uncharacterized protein
MFPAASESARGSGHARREGGATPRPSSLVTSREHAASVSLGENGAVRLSRSLAPLLAGATAVLLSASAVEADDRREAIGLRGFVAWGSLVSFPERDLGYFVTASGGVRQSRDGGRTWRRVGSLPPLVAVDFVSATDGFALTRRGALWTTKDGGRTWRAGRRFTPTPGAISGPAPAMVVDFVDRHFGVVASGPRRIFRTRDGGRSWQRLRFACPHSEYLGGLAFATRREGFASCGGQAATAMQHRSYHFTHSGGASWHHLRERVENGHVALLALPTARTRYVYASRLGIFRLGGRTLLYTNDTDSMSAMSWPSTRVGYALLLHRGLIRTVDGGRHWRRP